MTTSRTAYRTCPLCEATCGLELRIEDERVTRIRGDREDVFSKGFLCPKGTALGAFHEDPDRLRHPLIKTEDGHRRASWDEAFALIASKLVPLLDESERSAGAIYLGNPAAHSLDLLLYSRSVSMALGSRKVFSASTVDQRPREVASGLLYGSSLTIPVPDVDRSDLLVILGANPAVSNGSLATMPDWPARLADLSENDALVVIDPARTKTAQLANLHLAPIPGTDALLVAALATTIHGNGWHRPDELDREALDSVVESLAAFTPETVAEATGLTADDINALAERLNAAERPCIYGRLGTTITPFGTTTSWLIDVLNALLGSLDSPGGVLFPKGTTGSKNTRGEGPIGPEQRLGRRTTAVSQLPIELGEHPVAALSEEIEAQNIKALITIAGNPVLSTPDSGRLDEALDNLDFMVSVDCYLNETTRHANVILPVPSHLQKSHYDVAFANLSVRHVANYSPPIFSLADEQLPEWEVVARLASVLGGGVGTHEEALAVDTLVLHGLAASAASSSTAPTALDSTALDADAIVGAVAGRDPGPDRLLDILLQTGPFGAWFGHGDGPLSLAALADAPHGLDLGPLEPRFPEVLLTPSGRPEFTHPDLLGDVGRLEQLLHDDPGDGLRLINRRTLRSNNSWMHNLGILVKGKPRCTLQIHPDDASPRGLDQGAVASVSSRAGSIKIEVELDETLRPGVVSIPHGWGHDLAGTEMSVARQRPGVNVNSLTPTDVVDPLSGTSQLTGFEVEVRATGR